MAGFLIFNMPKAKNIESVARLKDKVAKSKGLVLTDYRGLTHKQIEDLHKALRAVEADYVVVKNSLLKIAASSSDFKLPGDQMTGPTAGLFAYGDTLAAVKELYKFIKSTTLPKVKLSIIDGQEYDAAATAKIAALPSKEGLIAQLMFTLNANTQKLAYLLTQIKK